MTRIAFLSIMLALVFSYTNAQDAYFSQMYANPLELNPALTGAFEGSFRLGTVYRDQWSGLTDTPYRTYSVSGELRYAIGQRQRDMVGGGIYFMSDRVPAFDFNTTGFRLSGAYHKNLDEQTRQYLSGGFMVGIIQKNVNIEELTFNDQFNGLDGYTFGTNELLPENNYAFMDLAVGVNYSVSPSDELMINAGIGIFHPHQPSSTFATRSSEIADPVDIALYTRWSGYASSVLVLNNQLDLLPRISMMFQGQHQLIQAGSNVRFAVNEYFTNFLHLGAGLRLTNDLESLAPAALIAFAGYEIRNLLLGFSYDMNLGSIAQENLGNGVFEFSIRYIGDYDNSANFCPSF